MKNKNTTEDKQIIGQPTETSPDADPNKSTVFGMTEIESLDLPVPEIARMPKFSDPISHLDEAELTPEQKERFKQIGIIPTPRGTGAKIVLVSTPRSDSAFARALSRASQMPDVIMNPTTDENTSERAATTRAPLMSEVLARGFQESLKRVGEAAARATEIVLQMHKRARVETGALSPSVKIDVIVGKRRRQKSESDKKEKSLNAGFPLDEKNLSVLRSVRERVPETLDDVVGRATAGGFGGGELFVLAARPATNYISPALLAGNAVVEKIRSGYIQMFSGLSFDEQVQKAAAITGFGEKRVRKLLKRKRNAQKRAGAVGFYSGFALAAICVDALAKKAQRQIGSNVAAMESLFYKSMMNGDKINEKEQ